MCPVGKTLDLPAAPKALPEVRGIRATHNSTFLGRVLMNYTLTRCGQLRRGRSYVDCITNTDLKGCSVTRSGFLRTTGWPKCRIL